jgi:hypothetical protein
MFDICAIDSATMQDIERLADVGCVLVCGEHFADPGGSTAMRACHKDGVFHGHLSVMARMESTL